MQLLISNAITGKIANYVTLLHHKSLYIGKTRSEGVMLQVTLLHHHSCHDHHKR